MEQEGVRKGSKSTVTEMEDECDAIYTRSPAYSHDSIIEMSRLGLLVSAKSGSRQRIYIAIARSDAARQWTGRLAIVQRMPSPQLRDDSLYTDYRRIEALLHKVMRVHLHALRKSRYRTASEVVVMI
ncbi:hypothetical protein ARMGADRAFT_1069043 [Armillaria gallica]|uniref:Uncharacterized protein n=1 Tax=Armillaria gallica TaxID=47427 RepID=A0A2H3CB99_ARMGA|nr:hypothetical protein ARMGADRAFT_1171955 [Armillaria gallica]PBK80339.1 hypothetical protein ARMGADRAFT_1069043 [Armillaria gallica]